MPDGLQLLGDTFDERDWLRTEVDRLRERLRIEQPVTLVPGLRAPFPYFGSKRIAAPLIWDALGNPGNLVIPFAGSLAELWARPQVGKVETINDASGLVANVWRAIQGDPGAVAVHADHPVIEVDLHAWHRTLVEAAGDLCAKLRSDPRFFDAELAGRWVWGASAWLGGGWCDGNLYRRIALGGRGDGRSGSPQPGHGIHKAQLPHLQGSDGTGVGYGSGVHNGDGRRVGLTVWMQQLADRLRLVRIVCGDFARVVTPAVTVSHGLTGIIWDPPYDMKERCSRIYDNEEAKDTPHADTVAQRAATAARALEAEHGPLLRQVFCGYEGEHEFPGWTCVSWRARGGYGLQAHGRGRANRERERLWLSPNCLRSNSPRQLDLVGGTS